MGKGSFRNKLILISIVDVLMIANDLYLYIPWIIFGEETAVAVAQLVMSLLGTVLGYYVTIRVINDGSLSSNFKNKRQKEFLKAQKKDKNDVMQNKKTNAIVFGLGFLFSGGLLIYLFLSESKNYLYYGIFGLLTIGCLVLFFISLSKTSKKFTLVLLVKTEDYFKIFERVINPGEEYLNYLKPLSDSYFVRIYGEVLLPKDKHIVYGLEIDELNEDLLNHIQLDKSNFSFYSKLIKEFDKGKKMYSISLNEDYSIIEKTETSRIKA